MGLHRSSSVLVVAMAIFVIMVQIEQLSAKQTSRGLFRFIPYKKTSRTIRTGGCSSFGHSCFGGHGKRADEDVLLLPGSDSEPQRLDLSLSSGTQDDDVMMQTGPEFGSRSSPSQSAVASSLISPPHQYNLSPFLRQWLQSYRRSSGDIEAK